VALYQAALDQFHGGGAVEQQYLLTGTVDAQRARPSTLKSRLDACDGALVGIAAGLFPVNKGEQCLGCPFWLMCPLG
jgi:hypothetical protein